jgi:hypothetical protein
MSRLLHLKKLSYCGSIPWNSPPYSANEISITLPAAAPATAMRASIERSSRRRIASSSTPRKGCAAYPSESRNRAMADRRVVCGSHVTRARERLRSRRTSTAPATMRGVRSTSHTQAAQCTPSRYSSTERTPFGASRTYSASNAGSSNSS